MHFSHEAHTREWTPEDIVIAFAQCPHCYADTQITVVDATHWRIVCCYVEEGMCDYDETIDVMPQSLFALRGQ